MLTFFLKGRSLIFYPILFFLVWNFPVFGKSGHEHNADIYKAFDYVHLSEKGRLCLQEIASGFAEYIDDTNVSYGRNKEKILDQIKKICPEFKTSVNGNNLTHRIFFHVGFNKRVTESPGLRQCIESATKDRKKQKEIESKIQKEQSIRNLRMCKCVRDAIRKNSSNGRCNLKMNKIKAIAALVYDIHILGDYIVCSGTEKSLAPLESIVGDIINAIRDFECPDKKRIKTFQSNINASKSKGTSSPLGRLGHADQVLQCLQNELPKIIEATPDVRKALWNY